MKALTLWRPWSDAIARGPKRVENRPWCPPGYLVGQQRFAIHAGRTYQRGDWPMPDGYIPPASAESPEGIVGVACILGFLDTRDGARRIKYAPEEGHRAPRLLALDSDPWWAGPVGWLLGDVVAIEPVPAKGALGLWDLSSDQLARVLEAEGAALERAGRTG